MKFKIQHSKPTFFKKDVSIFKPVLESSYVAAGRIVRDFEKQFAKYIDCEDAVATNCGTSAIHLSLLALGIGKRDEVIIPTYVSEALLNAVNYVNATPILVDMDYDTLNMSIKDIKKKLTNKTKAIIMPHMFGLPCDIDDFLKLGLLIIEDCSHSLGARYKKRITGSFGIVTICSFYATKFITTGYGGIIASNSEKILDKVRDLNEMDKREDYKIRYMYKMSDLQAALGISQLKHLSYFIKRRKEIAKAYTSVLYSYDLKLPIKKNDRDHVFYRYLVKSKKAASIRRYLEKNNIEVIPPVYKPLHRYLSMDRNDFPNTERIVREVISLPIYPALKKNELSKIIRVVQEASSKMILS